MLLRDAAAMSMYRYSATTPYSMFPVFRGTRVGKNVFAIVLIVQLSFLTILSQFMSTICVADMNLGHYGEEGTGASHIQA